MGIFDFVKDAGSKILGLGKDDEPAAPEQPTKRIAHELEQAVRDLELGVDELRIFLEGDTAIVHGTAGSQQEREKVVLVVGNTAGVARVDDRMRVEAPEPEATFYTVVSGDTLWKIAEEHYGNGNEYPVIFEANKPMLKDPDKIYPGQVLRIPPLEAEDAG